MKVHVISETPFIMKATGVHTAFVEHIELLREKGDIQVVVNDEGTGDVFHGHTYGLYYIWKGRKYKGRRVFTAHVIPEVKFVWAGGRPFGGLTEGIKRIDERFRNARVNFINAGTVDLEDMPLIYAAADLMLFPSYQENCPLAPIEAAACGMPVIYRDIEEYKTLYKYQYLKASSTDEFISLTRRMINDRQFYEEGLKISEQLLIQFDKEIIREKLIAVYKGLLNDWQSSVMLSAPLIS